MDADSKSKPLHGDLDTSFVNLWSLLRSLTQKGFIGRVHVESTDYSADVFVNGSASPLVHEIDHVAGTETLEEAALHRLVLRAREAPGTISVFEGADEAAVPILPSSTETTEIAAPPPSVDSLFEQASEVPVTPTNQNEITAGSVKVAESPPSSQEFRPPEALTADIYPAGSYSDWPAILATTGELISAIERGVNASGGDFDSLFTDARVELADDYSFLDPFARTFLYENGVATLNQEPAVKIFVSALGEALRRTIDRAAVGERARRVRERVALEMLTVARKHGEVLERSGLQAQLDRIAGTRVM